VESKRNPKKILKFKISMKYKKLNCARSYPYHICHTIKMLGSLLNANQKEIKINQ